MVLCGSTFFWDTSGILVRQQPPGESAGSEFVAGVAICFKGIADLCSVKKKKQELCLDVDEEQCGRQRDST